MRYTFSGYTRPGELHEFDPATGEDLLLKRARVLGDFDPCNYMERRMWITARGWRTHPRLPWSGGAAWRSTISRCSSPATARTRSAPIRILRGPAQHASTADVLYAVPHIRGGGEMGRAWYEQGRRLAKRHSFEDFVDAVAALQDAGLADPRAHRGRRRVGRAAC